VGGAAKDYQRSSKRHAPDAYGLDSDKTTRAIPAALKRLLANGVKLLPFSNEIMAACYKTSGEVYDESATKKRQVQEGVRAVEEIRDEQVQWFSIAENRYDNFMVRAAQFAATRRRRSKPQEKTRMRGLFLLGAARIGRRARLASSGVSPPGSSAALRCVSGPCSRPLSFASPPVTRPGNAMISATIRPLDQHKRHGAPVDLPGGDAGNRLSGDLVDEVPERRHAAQIEQRETERRVHERGLHVHPEQHAEPDQVDTSFSLLARAAEMTMKASSKKSRKNASGRTQGC